MTAAVAVTDRGRLPSLSPTIADHESELTEHGHDSQTRSPKLYHKCGARARTTPRPACTCDGEGICLERGSGCDARENAGPQRRTSHEDGQQTNRRASSDEVKTLS